MGGGTGRRRKMAAGAQASGLPCRVRSSLELGVARAAMPDLTTATIGVGAEEFPCHILGPLAYEHDLLAQPIEFRDGAVRAPSGSGLGVELDEAMLARYRV